MGGSDQLRRVWLTQPSGLQTVFARPNVLPAPGRRWPVAKCPLSGAVLTQKPELDQWTDRWQEAGGHLSVMNRWRWLASGKVEDFRLRGVSLPLWKSKPVSEGKLMTVCCDVTDGGTRQRLTELGCAYRFHSRSCPTRIKSHDTEWIGTFVFKWFVGFVLTSANCSNARSSERLGDRRDAEQPGLFFLIRSYSDDSWQEI